MFLYINNRYFYTLIPTFIYYNMESLIFDKISGDFNNYVLFRITRILWYSYLYNLTTITLLLIGY